ncbi:hypothetical protein B0O80DRAFT_423422 [Mortierella sp. GBAus27b]|nr:hypothetical protein B0O80DRAFT_423422 [Mortierella sp. GBAus27b]
MTKVAEQEHDGTASARSGASQCRDSRWMISLSVLGRLFDGKGTRPWLSLSPVCNNLVDSGSVQKYPVIHSSTEPQQSGCDKTLWRTGCTQSHDPSQHQGCGGEQSHVGSDALGDCFSRHLGLRLLDGLKARVHDVDDQPDSAGCPGKAPCQERD